MKKLIFYFTIAVLFLQACGSEQSLNQEEERNAPQVSFASFGESIDATNPATFAELPTLLADSEHVDVKLSGEIQQTCPKKGCWMTVKGENGKTIRVTFKDYGFFVPKEGQEGKQVVFDGVASMDTLSIESLRHFAEDAGKSAEEIAQITEPEPIVSFVATGVLIAEEETMD